MPQHYKIHMIKKNYTHQSQHRNCSVTKHWQQYLSVPECPWAVSRENLTCLTVICHSAGGINYHLVWLMFLFKKLLRFVCPLHWWLRAETNIHPLCNISQVTLHFRWPFSQDPSSPTCLITIEAFFQTPPPSFPKETTCNYNCLPH